MLIPAMQRIYKYIILLNSCFVLFVFPAKCQEKTGEQDAAKQPWFQGISVEYDVASLVLSAISKESYSTEAAVKLNIRNKYFPVVELGVAGAEKTSHNDYRFKTNGVFGRIGMDYNLLKPIENPAFQRYFFVGARLGLSPYTYDVTNVIIKDDYWGGETVRDFYGEKTTSVWVEILAGIRVEIFNNIYMGWTVRNKILFGQDNATGVTPWYIPGLGKRSGGHWAFNYSIGYSF